MKRKILILIPLLGLLVQTAYAGTSAYLIGVSGVVVAESGITITDSDHSSGYPAAEATLTLTNFTVSSGDILVVLVGIELYGNTTSISPTIVWDAAGVNESLTENSSMHSQSTYNNTHVFYLASPTAKTATITLTNEHDGAVQPTAIYAYSISGASVPSGTTDGVDYKAGAATSTTSVSATIDPPAGSIILSVFSLGEGNTFSEYGTGQTDAMEDENIWETASFASTREDNDASDAQSATASASTNRLVMTAVAIQPES